MSESKSYLIELLASAFNPELMPEVKLNLDEFRYYFTSHNLKNPSYRALLDLLKEVDSGVITPFIIKDSLINKANNTESEADSIILKIATARNFNSTELEKARYNIENVCYEAVLKKSEAEYRNKPKEYHQLVSQYRYKSLNSAKLKVVDFADLDATAVSELYLNNPIRSSLEVVNNSFTGRKGYLRSSLVTIVAKPKVGKSMLAMQEATNFVLQELKVHYLALGDLNEYDFLARISSQVTKTGLDETSSDIKSIRDKAMKILYSKGGRLRLTTLPAGKLTPKEYVEFVRNQLGDEEVVIIDYDYNFKMDNEDMYSRGGELYDLLSQIKFEMKKLTIVLTQPSKSYWSHPLLDDNCLGESSKKQMIVDAIITIGHYPKSGVNCGWINIPIQRRGTPHMTPYIMTMDGRFHEVPESLLQNYQGDPIKRYITSQELEIITKSLNQSSEHSDN